MRKTRRLTLGECTVQYSYAGLVDSPCIRLRLTALKVKTILEGNGLHFSQKRYLWTVEAVFKKNCSLKCGRVRETFPKTWAKIVWRNTKFSILYLEIGRYWERLHRISEVARFYLPNCRILLLQKSSLVRSWSVHQSVKYWKGRMTTRAWEWPHKVYVTPSVTCFFRRVFWRALLSSRAYNESKRPCLPVGYQTTGSWSRIFPFFFVLLCFLQESGDPWWWKDSAYSESVLGRVHWKRTEQEDC